MPIISTGLNYLLLLALAFTTGFEITILTFFCPRNLFRRHVKIIPMMNPTTNVTMIRRIPFPRVAGVRTYTGWRKCSPKIRLRKFCMKVGKMVIINARIRCINETNVPKNNPALNLLSMEIILKNKINGLTNCELTNYEWKGYNGWDRRIRRGRAKSNLSNLSLISLFFHEDEDGEYHHTCSQSYKHTCYQIIEKESSSYS